MHTEALLTDPRHSALSTNRDPRRAGGEGVASSNLASPTKRSTPSDLVGPAWRGTAWPRSAGSSSGRQLVDVEGRLQTRQWDDDAGKEPTSLAKNPCCLTTHSTSRKSQLPTKRIGLGLLVALAIRGLPHGWRLTAPSRLKRTRLRASCPEPRRSCSGWSGPCRTERRLGPAGLAYPASGSGGSGLPPAPRHDGPRHW
jgi:hypothetical protein